VRKALIIFVFKIQHMLKPFYYILFIALLASCRKKDKLINPDEVRILKTSASFNGATGNQIFDYDGQGRIIRISGNTNNEPPQTSATITYSGNEVFLKEPDIISAAVKISSETKYVLDATKKPLQRIRVETQEYFPPNNPQRNFTNDTTYYEYDAGGLLTKTTNNSRDSVWSNNGLTFTNLTLKRMVSSYAYNNSNPISATGSGTRFTRQFNGFITGEFNDILEESSTFDYSKGYANKTDFSNAFILNEYNVLFLLTYPLNKNNKNIPNKIIHKSVVKDIGGGNPFVLINETLNYTAAYNKYGFLSNLNSNAGPSSGLNLIYNK
jgi:hypothetical protein